MLCTLCVENHAISKQQTKSESCSTSFGTVLQILHCPTHIYAVCAINLPGCILHTDSYLTTLYMIFESDEQKGRKCNFLPYSQILREKIMSQPSAVTILKTVKICRLEKTGIRQLCRFRRTCWGKSKFCSAFVVTTGRESQKGAFSLN